MLGKVKKKMNMSKGIKRILVFLLAIVLIITNTQGIVLAQDTDDLSIDKFYIVDQDKNEVLEEIDNVIHLQKKLGEILHLGIFNENQQDFFKFEILKNTETGVDIIQNYDVNNQFEVQCDTVGNMQYEVHIIKDEDLVCTKIINIIVTEDDTEEIITEENPNFSEDINQDEQSQLNSEKQIEIYEDNKEKWVFFGDSLTARNHWETMYPDYEIVNAGVGRETTANMLQRIDNILAEKPEKIFIMGGINDLTQGSNPEQVVVNLQQILERIKAELPETAIYVQSVLPTGESLVNNSFVDALNLRISRICEQMNISYVHLYSKFIENESIYKELYYGDGVHLNVKGYAVWKAVLDEVLSGGTSSYPDIENQPEDKLYGSLTNSASANEYVARTMTLTASASGGEGAYSYQFEEEYNGARKVVQEYSSKNTYIFKTKEEGKHIYYATIKDSKGKSLTLSYTLNVVKNPALSLKGNIISGTSSTQYEQRNVTLTAKMSNGYGEYEYQFTEVYGGKTTIVQKYSEKDSYSFQTEGVGYHTYYVDVRDGIGQTLRMSYVLEVRAYPIQELKGNLTNSASANEYVARTMTLTATVTSGNGKYSYQFEEEYNGVRKIVQEYSSKNTYTFKTKEEGKHIYYATIKDSKGKSLTLSYTLNVVKNPALSLKGNIISSTSSTQYEQRNVTLTAKMSNGYGEYEYQFTEVYGGKTTIVQKYSEKDSYSFQAEGVGYHTYYVDVKDGIGQTLRMSYVLEVRKNPHLTEEKLKVNITSNKTSTEYSERDIILTAIAGGGKGGYEYQFAETYNGTRRIVQAYSRKNTYEFRTKDLGTYIYTVTVRDKDGETAAAAYSMVVVAYPATQLSGKLTLNSSSKEYVERNIVLTAQLNNQGYGDCMYQFSRVLDGKEDVLKPYSKENVYTFKTDKVGVNEFYVTVKDKRGQVLKIKCDTIVTVVSHPSKLLQGTLTSNKTNNEYSSRDIVLTATAINQGYGNCEYEFVRVYDGASKVVQSYSTKNTYTFKTGLPGPYIYYVKIRDKAGAVLQLSYSMTVISNGTFDKGIDVSEYQGNIDWAKVKSSGVSFAMLRVLSGKMGALEVDPKFYDNIAGATKNGISVGVYRYGYAMTEEEARREALMTVQAIKNSGYEISYPVAYDVEDVATQGKLSKSQLTKVIKAYQAVIESNGYKFMIYSSKNWFETKIDMKQFAGEDLWVASWFLDNSPYHDHGYKGPGNVTMWQYTATGKVPGINGDVDMNVGYVRY